MTVGILIRSPGNISVLWQWSETGPTKITQGTLSSQPSAAFRRFYPRQGVGGGKEKFLRRGGLLVGWHPTPISYSAVSTHSPCFNKVVAKIDRNGSTPLWIDLDSALSYRPDALPVREHFLSRCKTLALTKMGKCHLNSKPTFTQTMSCLVRLLIQFPGSSGKRRAEDTHTHTQASAWEEEQGLCQGAGAGPASSC